MPRPDFPLILALLLAISACDNTARDDQDALDDTKSAIDVALDGGNGDASLFADAPADATTSVDWTGPGALVSIDEFGKAIAQLECEHIVNQCNCLAPQNSKPDVPACTAILAPAIAKTWSNGGLSVRADLLPYCVSALQTSTSTCASPKPETVPACIAALRWPGSAGDACGGGGPFLCADGSVCEGKKCTGNHLSQLAIGDACSNPLLCGDAACVKNDAGKGTCIAPLSPGKACTYAGQCAAPALCKSGICTVPGQSGDKCTSIVDCGPGLDCIGNLCAVPSACAIGAPCGNGGLCLGDVKNTCKNRLAVDSPCSADSQCVDSAYCSTKSKKCVTKPGIGIACGNSAVCASGLGCDSEKGTCQNLPGKGEKCAIGPDGPYLCSSGLACAPGTFLCQPAPLENQPCANPATCSDADIDGDGKGGDLACNATFKGSVCMKKLALGAQCQNNACQSGLFCDDSTGKCALPFASGATCTSDIQCGANRCVPNSHSSLSCAPIPTLGEACLKTCGDGLFCEAGVQTSACQPPVCADLYALQ